MSDLLLQCDAGGKRTSSVALIVENGQNEEEEEEEDDEDEDLDDEVYASRLEKFMRDRRRAKSLPAYPEQVALLEGVSGNNERKRVKFADSMGLDLASIKHFSSQEDPQIPSKVLSRHRSFPPQQQDFLGGLCAGFRSALTLDRLVACFPEPCEAERRTRLLRVCLEKIAITQFDVRGLIRVCTGRSSGKEVGVRYTFNDWLSHVDTQALRVDADPKEPGFVGERYSFTMYTPPFMDPSSSVHFAVYLRSEDGEFWDNNGGQDYSLQYHCLPGTESFTSSTFHAT
ncbi:protein phosphatase 1 regulatory subunit 3G [Genypterus blacodes]|uniref:protein phosphatase 1 regulatory subunit 3G n=1 Tax=Genypterus blacodes TaxID=154954 RepID=UPI003F775A08